MRPNILFLFPDQHRGDWLPYEKEFFDRMGMEEIPLKMPNLKKIMGRGVTFRKAYTSSPLCAPARACLASGKKYENCRVRDNGDDYPINMPTFYSALKDSGYSVGGVGKFDLHKPTHWWGLDGWIDDLDTLGFTHGIDNAGKLNAGHSGMIEAKDPYMAMLEENGLREYHAHDILERNHSVESTELPDRLYCDTWLSQNAIDMIEDFPKDKPWFIQVNFTGPHFPWDVTKSMRERWKNVDFQEPHNFVVSEGTENIDLNGIRQNYAAMLENIDKQIGRILDCIKEKGQLENTVIVYASDHGEMLGDWGKFEKSIPERGSIHIPMIISTPDMKEQVETDELVELVDLTRTFTDWAGVSFEGATESESLCNFLEKKSSKTKEYISSALWDWKTIISSEAKLVMRNNVPTELYLTEIDPWQDNNLIEDSKYKGVLDSILNNI